MRMWWWWSGSGNGGDEWMNGEESKGEKAFNHTDTTRSHVSGNHDGALALLELVKNPIALVLLLVSVDGWEGY